MALIFGWFIGTLVIPLLVPLDKLFGFPMGSFTVISWFAAGVSAVASENHAKRKMAFNREAKNETYASIIGKILFWTFALAIGIALVKALFSN